LPRFREITERHFKAAKDQKTDDAVFRCSIMVESPAGEKWIKCDTRRCGYVDDPQAMTELMDTPARDRPSEPAETGPNHALLFGMLLQQHQATLSERLVRSVLGRVLSVGVALYIILPGELTPTQIVGSASAAILIAVGWTFETHRLTAQSAGLEETIARRTDPDSEDLYIASRYFLRFRDRGFALSWILPPYEPLLWLALNVALIVLATLVGGIAG
jgi:hypothetical protein